MKRALITLCAIAAAIILLPVFSLAGTATISWNANTDEDLAGYRIYYGNTKGGPYGSSTALISKTQTSYTVTNLSDGTYYFVVTAVDTADNESPYSAEASKTIASTTAVAASVTLASSPASPQRTGTAVTFTAMASGGSGSYEYQFWKKTEGGSWSVAQNYSSKNTFTWVAPNSAGRTQITVWARNAGSTGNYEAYKAVWYVISNVPKVSSVTLSSNPASPQKTGAAVTFTAKASGGSGAYEYQFWKKPAGGSWSIAQNYSSKNTFTWKAPNSGGATQITVWVRNAAASNNYDAYKSVWYVIK